MPRHREFIGDPRKISFCIYCNNAEFNLTREHSPSKVFLDVPLPENLPITYSCKECNSSFSKDEEYVSALIECFRCNSFELDVIERDKIKKILKRHLKLHEKIKSSFDLEKGIITIDVDRINNVILKLARGHLTFEMCEIALAVSRRNLALRRNFCLHRLWLRLPCRRSHCLQRRQIYILD